MTHYRVAVIAGRDEVDGLLDRYDENMRVEPYVDVPRDEALSAARDEVERAAGKVADGTANEYEHARAAHVRDSDDELLAWYADFRGQELDGDGNLMSSYNPDSKYDYYSVIGEMSVEEWAAGDGRGEEELRETWRKVSTSGDGFWRPEYYLERYGDEDTFVKAMQTPGTWSVVTPDGEWYEPGAVGWFGMDDATAESMRAWADGFHRRFVEPYLGGRVTILDCHI